MGNRGDAKGVAAGRLGEAFFRRDAETVAIELLGKVLVRRVGRLERRARIVETEAYVGPHDLASHSSRGRTKRTEVMFGPAGRAYVYLIYGMYQMLNIVTGEVGDAQAVLIRAAEPLGWKVNLSGPGRLARGMGITPVLNGADLTSSRELFVLDGAGEAVAVARTPRVGVDYAGEWKHELLRFYDAGSLAVSKGPKA